MINDIVHQRIGQYYDHTDAEPDREEKCALFRCLRFRMTVHVQTNGAHIRTQVITITVLRQMEEVYEVARAHYAVIMDEILDRVRADEEATNEDYQEAVEPSAAAHDKYARKLAEVKQQISEQEAKLVRLRADPPINLGDYMDLAAEFDSQPIKLIDDGRGLFPMISSRIGALDG